MPATNRAQIDNTPILILPAAKSNTKNIFSNVTNNRKPQIAAIPGNMPLVMPLSVSLSLFMRRPRSYCLICLKLRHGKMAVPDDGDGPDA
ncbi:MAG: hypothetical protein FWD64_03880 [Acidobacteriaceae bacterium]|nr:hypothetical protein [Acidobacteriaceae bacterium]